MSCLLVGVHLTICLGVAILFVSQILNKVPHKKLDKAPYEMWKGHTPNLKYVQV